MVRPSYETTNHHRRRRNDANEVALLQYTASHTLTRKIIKHAMSEDRPVGVPDACVIESVSSKLSEFLHPVSS
jgi:hypothetical protein